MYTCSHAIRGSSAVGAGLPEPWHMANGAPASLDEWVLPEHDPTTPCNTSYWSLLCLWARNNELAVSMGSVVVTWPRLMQSASPPPKPWWPITKNMWIGFQEGDQRHSHPVRPDHSGSCLPPQQTPRVQGPWCP